MHNNPNFRSSVNNRLHNCTNPFQGDTKKVLCVCSAGLLRSPTAAVVLSQEPFNFNTRAAGLEDSFALIPVDDVLLHWADEIVCMDRRQARDLTAMVESRDLRATIKCLDISDDYSYRDPVLMKMIAERYTNNQGV